MSAMKEKFIRETDAAEFAPPVPDDCDWDSPGVPLSSDPDAELARLFYEAAKSGKPLVVELLPPKE